MKVRGEPAYLIKVARCEPVKPNGMAERGREMCLSVGRPRREVAAEIEKRAAMWKRPAAALKVAGGPKDDGGELPEGYEQ